MSILLTPYRALASLTKEASSKIIEMGGEPELIIKRSIYDRLLEDSEYDNREKKLGTIAGVSIYVVDDDELSKSTYAIVRRIEDDERGN